MRHVRFHEHLALAAETLTTVKILSAALGMEQYLFVTTRSGSVHQGRQDLVA